MNRASDKIRALLRGEHSDGLSAPQLARRIGKDARTTMRALRGMPDTYIDRYYERPEIKPTAIWCSVAPPPDCPPPTETKRNREFRLTREGKQHD